MEITEKIKYFVLMMSSPLIPNNKRFTKQLEPILWIK